MESVNGSQIVISEYNWAVAHGRGARNIAWAGLRFILPPGGSATGTRPFSATLDAQFFKTGTNGNGVVPAHQGESFPFGFNVRFNQAYDHDHFVLRPESPGLIGTFVTLPNGRSSAFDFPGSSAPNDRGVGYYRANVVVAPGTAPGDYLLKWSVFDTATGQTAGLEPSMIVRVSGSATFLAPTGVTTVPVGGTELIDVRVRNDSSRTWQRTTDHLHSVDPGGADVTYPYCALTPEWLGGDAVAFDQASVPPGQTADYHVRICGQSGYVGTATLRLQFVQEGVSHYGGVFALHLRFGSTIASPPADVVPAGSSLSSGDSVSSADGHYVLRMQSDGNLVLYATSSALWASGTAGHPGATADMQADGNLVIYDSGNGALWASGTPGAAGAHLSVQDDGNMVIYRTDGTAAWSSASVNSVLAPGEALQSGQSLYSADERYQLIMQGDGNLVLYRGGRALWAAQTTGQAGARVVMQADGNLVVYSPSDAPLWQSNTAGQNGARLVVQDDGNLVLYHSGTAIYASHTIDSRLAAGEKLLPGQGLTSPDGQYSIGMQSDGNLVLYGPGPAALWSSSTNGHPGAYAIMQTDGNLVVYSSDNHALWASGTVGNSGAQLVVQDDGNLVIYGGGQVSWATGTNAAGACPSTPGPGDPVTRWRPVVSCVLRMLRLPTDVTAVNDVLIVIRYESGGNPNAINNTDVNAQRGDPSRGLMQTIGTTFEAHRSAILPDNIYDPAANIYAGLSYGVARYHSLANIPGVRSVNNGGPYVPY